MTNPVAGGVGAALPHAKPQPSYENVRVCVGDLQVEIAWTEVHPGRLHTNLSVKQCMALPRKVWDEITRK